MVSLDDWGLSGEPLAGDCVRDGATLVAMSGDKLLGGPQAGILVGSATAISACRRNPLARALRVDKLTLAALEATLRLYRDPAMAVREIPVLAMLTTSADSLDRRAHALAERLAAAGVHVSVAETEATVGGGAFPTARIPSRALAFERDPREMEAALRRGALPVIGRIEHQCLLLDLRAVSADRDDDLLSAVVQARTAVSTGIPPLAHS
jgi:L-seryl-tRNA(Ser) seleniumtransferase